MQSSLKSWQNNILYTILVVVLSPSTILADIDINATPNGYVPCPSTVYGTCTNSSYLGNTVQMDYWYTDGVDIVFRVRRCNSTSFSSSGTAYLKDGDICGDIVDVVNYSIGVSTIALAVPLNYWVSGDKNFTITLTSSTSDRFNAGTITITKSCEDYQVSNVILSDDQVHQGQQNVVASCNISNIGNEQGADDVTLFWSTDSNYDPGSDADLGDENFNLLGGQSTTLSRTFDVPPTMPPGNYYIVMYADENDSDEECQEWNNGSFRFFQVLAASDLEITTINSDDIQYCQDGNPTLMYTVRNTGEADAPAFHVDFYLSNNQSLGSSDIHLGRVTSPSLGDGVTQTRTANNLSIPTSTSPGDYYILAVIDDDELIPEQFENNNLFATSYEIDVLPSPNIIYPSEGDVISSLTPTFQWSSVSGATAYAIVVFSSTNSVIYSANVGNTTSFTLPTNVLNYDEEYSWVAGVSTSAGICPSDRIYFSVGCNDYFEPNNTFSSPDLSAFSTFGSSPSTESINAYITSESDVDYYLITTSNSGILNITLSSISENYDLELHYGDYSDLISASTNLGTLSENINYQHPGGTSTYLVKIYSFFDEYDCSDSYDLTIAWTPTGDGGGLALFQSINTSPSPIVYNRTGYFATRIINNNGLTWQGDLRLELLDEQGNDPPLNVIAEYNDTSIPSGGTDTLFHITNMPVSTLPGDYTLRVRYSDDNGITWNTVGNGGFPQPQPFKIVYSPIALNTAISVTPATVYQYSPAEFSAEIINSGNTGFTDSIALQLLDAQQTYLTNLDIDYVSLASDDTHILQLQSNSIQSDPGTYYVQVGAYIDGVWRKAHEGAFVNPFQFIIAAPLNQLSLTTPNGGESYTVNSTITITWTSTGTTGNISLELTDPLGTTIDVIADNIPNTGSFTYTIPNCLLAGDYRIELYETANTVNNDISDGVFSISGQGDFPCICSIDSPSLENGDETELVNAANFLCSKGIIIEGDGNTRPYDNITRGELAQIVFLALFETNEAQPSDNFPSPFGDLQTSSAWYYRFVKTLAYLDYNDGTSPFDREFDNFRPYDPINRQYVVKVLLEAFNISEDGLNFNPYNDVNTGIDNYSHIVTAYDLCLIGNPPNFRPTIPATRGEVFLMIYRLLQTCASNNVVIPTPTNDDFFCPGNYTPENLARSIGMAEGNFNTYSHNSFAIPGVKLPLVFGFQYNSYLTELPDALFPLRPLGHGWTHSYDSYILPVLGWSDAAGTTIEDQLILAWPTGQREVYFDSGGSYPYTCTARTEGTYNTLTVLSTSVIEVKTKGQTVYRYEKMSVGNGGEEAYLLTSIIERNGHTISVAYELGEAGEHRIATVTRQLGNSNTVRRQFSFSYKTGTNYLESVSIELPGMTGTSISFSVDNEGDLQTFTDRRSKTTSYGYARDLVPNMPADEYERVKHLLYTVQLPKGNTITNSYDKRKLNASATNGELLTQIDINFQYQDELQPITSNIQTISNENNNGTITQQVNVDFDKGSGSATRVVLNGDVTEYRFDDNRHPYHPTLIIDDGLKTGIQYNQLANPTRISDTLTQEGIVFDHIFAYDNYENVTSYTNPKGDVITNSFGGFAPQGLVQTVTDQENYQTAYSYYQANEGAWKVGAPKTVTSPLGITLNYTYDAFGNPDKVTAPGNIEIDVNHDLFGRPEQYTNPNGHEWQYTYYPNDILRQSINPYGDEVENIIDDNGNIIGIENEADQTTSLGYDFDTDLLESVSFGPNTESYTYYQDGRLKTIEKPDGTIITINYYNSGYGLGQVENDGFASYTYDSELRLKTVTKNNGSTTHTITYHYDGLDRIISYDYTVTGSPSYSYTIEYQYDLNSNISTIKYPNLGGSGTLNVQYRYYKNDWLKEVEDWEGKITQYFYRADGAVEYVLLPNGTRSDYSYDSTTQRISGISDTKSNGEVITQYSFVLDSIGNIRQETRIEPLDFPLLQPLRDTSSYDTNNFILTKNGISQTVDDNGNLTNDGEHTYSWDNHDYLTGRDGVTYRYDGLGMRRERLDNGTTTRYVLDIMGMGNVIAETDENGTPTAYYIHGAGLLYRKKPNGGGYDDHYYHYNFQGSTVAMTNEAETVTHKYSYSPYGVIWESDVTDFNAFTFNGKHGVMMEDEEFYFMRRRFYKADEGRFLSQDPVWSTNLFAFGGNNPVMNVDPLGLYTQGIVDHGDIGLTCSPSNVHVMADGSLRYTGGSISGVDHNLLDKAKIKFLVWYERKGGKHDIEFLGKLSLLVPIGGYSATVRATGGIAQWIRIGGSSSRSLAIAKGLTTDVVTFSLRWGARGRGNFRKIKNLRLRNLNKWFGNQRIPGSSWRTKDPGHFHFWKQ